VSPWAENRTATRISSHRIGNRLQVDEHIERRAGREPACLRVKRGIDGSGWSPLQPVVDLD
jgi:hypothetical protein